MSILLSAELEVDGNLTVTGTIQNDSLAQVIAQLEARIVQLECTNSGNIPIGYCDCFGNVLDICGVCGGDTQNEDECNYVMDIEGNIYEIVQIGNQKWMAENLATATYNNGTEIGSAESSYPYNSPNDNNLISETVCDPDCADTFGKLYQWNVIEHPGGICMEGWHVPSDNEWKELEIYLGMSESEANSTGWRGTNQGCQLAGNLYLWSLNEDVNADMFNNSQFGETGFDALPSGIFNGMIWNNMGYLTSFWTSSSSNNLESCRRTITSSSDGIDRDYEDNIRKYSIRCIKD